MDQGDEIEAVQAGGAQEEARPSSSGLTFVDFIPEDGKNFRYECL